MFFIGVLLWRYFTGAPFTGVPTTDATWFRKGRFPKHKVNWWSQKPRVHKAIYRWVLIAVPVGWLILYTHYRFWTLAGTIGFALYAIRGVWEAIHKRIPRTVQVGTFEAPAEIQNVEVPDDKGDLGEWPPPKRKAQ